MTNTTSYLLTCTFTKACLCILSCLVLALGWPAHSQAQWFADTGLELLVNDNLQRNASPSANDTGLAGNVSGGYYWQTGTYTGMSLVGSLQQTVWERWSGMNNLEAGLGVQVRHKFGLGDAVPVLRLDLGFNQQQFNAKGRDTAVTTTGISLGKRFTPALNLSLALRHEHSEGKHTLPVPPTAMAWTQKSARVWDYSAWTLSLQGEFDLSEASWLSAGLHYRDGDVVASSQPYPQINTAALAVGLDPAFGPLAVAYRLDARTWVYALDYNRALWRSSTWYVGGEYHSSSTTNAIDYEVGILRTGFIYSF